VRTIVERLAAVLCHPRLPWHLALLCVVLFAPALGIGWQFDDHFQRLMMIGAQDFPARPMEVFSSLRGGPSTLRPLMESGLLPWWTSPSFRLAFFRPLSVLSMWIDYQLWPDRPVLMHLHSLLWCGAVVALATILYRRLLGVSVWSGLAGLLYAVDDAHAMPAAWLANRNALIAAFFGFACLLAHDRWRRSGWKAGMVVAPVLLAAGLAAGEMALATAGWLAAYTLFVERAPWRARLRAVTGHAAVLAGWAAIYRLSGFGTFGSDFYQDPVTRSIAFLGAFVVRAPVLLMGQWTPLAADWGTFLSGEAAAAFLVAGVAVTITLALLLAPLVRRDRVARFMASGMLISLLPIAAVSPANRLLLFVGFGAMGLMALLARDVLTGVASGWGWRATVIALGIMHLVIAPLASPLLAWSMKPLGDPLGAAVATVPDDPAIAAQDLVLVNAPDYLYLVSHIRTLKLLEGKPSAKRIRVLGAGTSPVSMTRSGPNALRVRLPDGPYAGTLGRLFRSSRDPIHPGDRFDLEGLGIEVVDTNAEGDPVTVDYTFAVPLEDPSLRWLRWSGEGYTPFAPPPPGRTIRLPAQYGPMDLYRPRPAEERGMP